MHISILPRTLISAICPLLILAISSCRPSPTKDYQQRLAQTAEPARHAIHTDRLHAIMADLGRQVAKTWPQEMEAEAKADADRTRAESFENARKLGRALAETAEKIPHAVADVDMPDADREAFLASARMLRGQASSLARFAREQNTKRMRHTLNTIQTTCYGCHSQFSKYTGPLKFGQ
ncbi:MAG: cytochrome c [Planctomycetota bacterium]|nr:MAG: cytochrome c [Planctomycetota bacterium]